MAQLCSTPVLVTSQVEGVPLPFGREFRVIVVVTGQIWHTVLVPICTGPRGPFPLGIMGFMMVSETTFASAQRVTGAVLGFTASTAFAFP